MVLKIGRLLGDALPPTGCFRNHSGHFTESSTTTVRGGSRRSLRSLTRLSANPLRFQAGFKSLKCLRPSRFLRVLQLTIAIMETMPSTEGRLTFPALDNVVPYTANHTRLSWRATHLSVIRDAK